MNSSPENPIPSEQCTSDQRRCISTKRYTMRAFERCGLHVIAITVTFAVTPVYGGNISRNMVSAPLLPQGDNGIAAKYPGEVGIEDDPSVIFVEDFEEGSLTEMKARWENAKNINIMSLSTDVSGNEGLNEGKSWQLKPPRCSVAMCLPDYT